MTITKFWLNRLWDIVRVEYGDGHMTVADAHDEDIVALFDAALAGDGDERFAGWDVGENAAWAACDAAYEARRAA